MRAIALMAVGLLMVAAPVRGEEGFNPHRMVDESGQPDMTKCALCHTESLELARPKAEVCTFCHAATTHSGAAEHLRASKDEVARLLAAAGEKGPHLPLTEDGGMFCGTCHIFHDPAVSEDKPLASAWVPASTGVAGAVEESVAAKWNAAVEKYGTSTPAAKFSSTGTKALRLPVADGSLCVHCHRGQTR